MCQYLGNCSDKKLHIYFHDSYFFLDKFFFLEILNSIMVNTKSLVKYSTQQTYTFFLPSLRYYIVNGFPTF